MNLDYRNDRNAFGQRDVGSSEDSGHMNPTNSRQHSYGRDNASMRGNDFYGTQSYKSDYSRGNYSASTFNPGRSRQGGYAPNQMDKNYIEFPDYSNRPTYGTYAGSRAYTDFIDHNYGYPGAEPDSTRYSTLEENQATPSKRHKAMPFRSANQSRYSENDGRRR